MLKDGKSYQPTNFRIVEYKEEKFISMCWDGSKVQETDELMDVMELPVIESPIECVMENVQIAAVYNLEKGYKCIRCSSRTEPATEMGEARCCSPQCGILHFVIVLCPQKFFWSVRLQKNELSQHSERMSSHSLLVVIVNYQKKCYFELHLSLNLPTHIPCIHN